MSNTLPTQRRFAVMGMNTYKLVEKLSSNQRICRLLKYPVRNPFSDEYPDLDGTDLINKQLIIVPKLPDADPEKMSFVVARFDNFVVNQANTEFKITTLRFDIACPYDEWLLDDESLRPYLIMQEIDGMFNGGKLAGIGNLQFHSATSLVLSPQLGGYSMTYKINEFN